MKDIFGVDAKVGDRIAAGMTYGQSATLRIGYIRKLTVKEDSYKRLKWTATVEWTHGHTDLSKNDMTTWGIPQQSNIYVDEYYSRARFMIIPEDLGA